MEAKASQSAPLTFRPSTQTMTSLALATLMANKKAPGMRRICTKCSATHPHPSKECLILFHCDCVCVFLKITRLEETGTLTFWFFVFPFALKKKDLNFSFVCVDPHVE